MVIWLVKLAVFFITSYVAARVALKYFRKRNIKAAASDPEILAVAAVAGAFITGLVMFVVKRLVS